jgi:hypothetical protein
VDLVVRRDLVDRLGQLDLEHLVHRQYLYGICCKNYLVDLVHRLDLVDRMDRRYLEHRIYRRNLVDLE